MNKIIHNFSTSANQYHLRVVQSFPVHPVRHSHVYELPEGVQVPVDPVIEQGLGKHSPIPITIDN